MRDHLTTSTAKDPSSYFFDDFTDAFTTALSLNWPYEPAQCLLPTADNKFYGTSMKGETTRHTTVESALAGNLGDDEDFMINPVFESHLRNLENWSVGPAFQRKFPDLVEEVRVKDR